MVDLWTPGKTFGYGLVIGGLGGHFLPKYIEQSLERMGNRIGENVARRIKEGQSPGLNPGLNPGNEAASYNILSALNALSSRLDQMEKVVYKGG